MSRIVAGMSLAAGIFFGIEGIARSDWIIVIIGVLIIAFSVSGLMRSDK